MTMRGAFAELLSPERRLAGLCQPGKGCWKLMVSFGPVNECSTERLNTNHKELVTRSNNTLYFSPSCYRENHTEKPTSI